MTYRSIRETAAPVAFLAVMLLLVSAGVDILDRARHWLEAGICARPLRHAAGGGLLLLADQVPGRCRWRSHRDISGETDPERYTRMRAFSETKGGRNMKLGVVVARRQPPEPVMASPGVPERQREAAREAVAAVLAIRAVPAGQPYREFPIPREVSGRRYSTGRQYDREAGTCLAVAGRGEPRSVKVMERFPLTGGGWARAWRALVRTGPDAAQIAVAQLAERAARVRARAEGEAA